MSFEEKTQVTVEMNSQSQNYIRPTKVLKVEVPPDWCLFGSLLTFIGAIIVAIIIIMIVSIGWIGAVISIAPLIFFMIYLLSCGAGMIRTKITLDPIEDRICINHIPSCIAKVACQHEKKIERSLREIVGVEEKTLINYRRYQTKGAKQFNYNRSFICFLEDGTVIDSDCSLQDDDKKECINFITNYVGATRGTVLSPSSAPVMSLAALQQNSAMSVMCATSYPAEPPNPEISIAAPPNADFALPSSDVKE
ncbi:uncharacterized protein MONOS_2863 [Monocercomonoides exilis]|uniref:uncharacterized protein n=1 Tax=Monocercomonoides exilis TaxID=2049356 RepID=UPI003559535B|nr:hypothetical protein MONOS_2863 [Monocercomonoides exilis]|eukprot:MONOS_2863.1-p1 / transcript=MONOS_2863.1 / gene=MONOS_2863 / organism=Monocercomonoides_exilis_PA203 / gene_product=unspecified product / transcript_product=unspecified product / location=Mono_scaffold00062:51288-52300(-) / protein_length=251 / sequence_SO=supercontig / SO=protein_coding / is_pseudo=false